MDEERRRRDLEVPKEDVIKSLKLLRRGKLEWGAGRPISTVLIKEIP